jgi:hypothetical protein
MERIKDKVIMCDISSNIFESLSTNPPSASTIKNKRKTLAYTTKLFCKIGLEASNKHFEVSFKTNLFDVNCFHYNVFSCN